MRAMLQPAERAELEVLQPEVQELQEQLTRLKGERMKVGVLLLLCLLCLLLVPF